MPTAKPVDPDALLASRARITGTGCGFGRIMAKLPPELAEPVTRWIATDPEVLPAEQIADAISEFSETYSLGYPTHVTGMTVNRHRPLSKMGRKCRTCGIK